jgi:hypothetical protein
MIIALLIQSTEWYSDNSYNTIPQREGLGVFLFFPLSFVFRHFLEGLARSTIER